MFRYAPSCSKFYYITRLCEMGLHRKFLLFYIFQIKTILFFSLNLDSTWKGYFFEVYFVTATKESTYFNWSYICKWSLCRPPKNFLILKVHQHVVPQKITFFMKNSKLNNKNIVSFWKKSKKCNFLCSPISHRRVM